MPPVLSFARAEILPSGYLIRPCDGGGSVIHIVDHMNLEVRKVISCLLDTRLLLLVILMCLWIIIGVECAWSNATTVWIINNTSSEDYHGCMTSSLSMIHSDLFLASTLHHLISPSWFSFPAGFTTSEADISGGFSVQCNKLGPPTCSSESTKPEIEQVGLSFLISNIDALCHCCSI